MANPTRPRGGSARLACPVRTWLRGDAARYTEILTGLLLRKLVVPIAAAAILALGGVLFILVGRDFFPLIDGGQIQLHVRAPAGTRIEKTEEMFQAIEDKIREVIPG